MPVIMFIYVMVEGRKKEETIIVQRAETGMLSKEFILRKEDGNKKAATNRLPFVTAVMQFVMQ